MGMRQPVFEQCAVAFLDILGFSDFIAKVEIPSSDEARDFARLQKVIAAQLVFTTNNAKQQHRFPKDVGLEIIHISDSFILSAPISNNSLPGYNGLTAVMIKTIQLAHQLLKTGFLMRGGIAVGNVYRTSKNIFGTGYQNAYKTEQGLRTPNVRFHQSVLDFLKEDTYPGFPVAEFSIFAQEADQLLLDTLNTHWSYVGEKDEDRSKIPEIFSGYRTTIERNLAGLPPGGARDKWEWMARFFNAKLRDASDLRSMTRIQIEDLLKFRFGPAVEEPPPTFHEAFGQFMPPTISYVKSFKALDDPENDS